MSEWSPLKPVTPEVKHICIEMKSQVQRMAGADFVNYIPVNFISKDEDGVNYTYIVKVDVGGETCVHAKILQAGGGEKIVQDVHYPKSINDPVVPI